MLHHYFKNTTCIHFPCGHLFILFFIFYLPKSALLHLICISMGLSHCMLHQVLLASPLGTLSDPGISVFQRFVQIISFLLGLIVTDLQWWIQLSVVWQYHRSCCYIGRATRAFVAPPVGHCDYKMYWWNLYYFPLLYPCNCLILSTRGNASDRRQKWILHRVIRYLYNHKTVGPSMIKSDVTSIKDE